MTVPQKALPLLECLLDIEESYTDRYVEGSDDYDYHANECVFICLWMAKIFLSEFNDEDKCREFLEKAEYYFDSYDDESYEEDREHNRTTIQEIKEMLDKRNKRPDAKTGGNSNFPKQFDDHLMLLEKKKAFSIINSEVGHTRRLGYLITGNRGTGKRTAAMKLFDILSLVDTEITSWAEVPAAQLFDPCNGFSGIDSYINDNKHSMIYISDAEDLRMKGLLSQSGIEILAAKIKTEPSVCIVLSGRCDELTQLVNSCPAASEYFVHRFHFEDFKPEILTEIAVKYADDHGYSFTKGAQHELFNYFSHEYKMRGSEFGNVRMVHHTIDDLILPALIQRVVDDNMELTDSKDITTITSDDIPKLRQRDPKQAIQRLESLVGLENIKQSVMAHASLVNLNNRRMELGLFNHMPPMHMVFTGNPGTGKTTVAELIGEIYYGMGVLSSGHLVEVDRSKLVGQFIGDTEKNTLNAIKSAAGGVLFIDEAYNLFTNDPDRRDFGLRVIETLLTYLSLENTNMIVILAGYTIEMEHLLQSNPGLKSRFSYIFHFNDYTPEQLMKIGKFVLKKEQYEITPEAEKKLTQYVINAYSNKDEHFGNGRFITRLLTTKIIPNVSDRLYKMDPASISKNDQVTITEADIPDLEELNNSLTWDAAIIDDALEQLNELAGLEHVKKALNEYVMMM